MGRRRDDAVDREPGAEPGGGPAGGPAGGPGGGPLVTPDGRYLVVRGRLWRRADPALGEERRAALVAELMAARRAKGAALRTGDDAGVRSAKERVQAAKEALGERGPVWWSDGAPDLTRRTARTTAYADWFAALEQQGEEPGGEPGGAGER